MLDTPVENKPEYKVIQNVDVLIKKGIFQQEVKKEYKVAIEIYDSALDAEEERSKRSELLYRKAMCRERLGDREGQLEIFNQLIQYGVESNQWAKKADETMRIQNEREGGPVRSKIDAKSRWSLKQPLYGQIKFVPDDPITKSEKATGWRVVKSLEWFGPMERYVNFSLTNSVMTSGETYTNEGIMIRGEGRLTSGYGKVLHCMTMNNQAQAVKLHMRYRLAKSNPIRSILQRRLREKMQYQIGKSTFVLLLNII